MTTHPTRRLIAAVGALALLAGAAAADDDMDYYMSVFEPLPALPPIPADNSLTAAKVELGKMLFFEPRLSASGVISCATCHNPALGWADRLPRGTGHEGQIGLRNTPTVLNSGFLPNQFWDGREPDLEGQALGPIQAPDEMAMDLEEALERIAEFDIYIEHFTRAFPEDETPISAENVAYALASFQRTLNTPNSPFDRFLRGDQGAMTEQQVRGMMAFADNGCVACHQGPALTDGLFHRFELPGPTDLGRFVVTGEEHDRYAFRTPTLRNVAVTYPYFHNGSIDTLHDAVNLMGEQMLGQEFDDDTLNDIVAFLHALTGEQPVVNIPALP
ncbi:cytochrome-c peroxidase [Rhodobaculum claviforme]|uniref:Cytochrome-c peroxidase n=1 Tax=Rhodobaculum claviforme TaxID=1549854 RepID=A0A934TKR7_9RHOB|nr:cytochrome-c peroxidase [Rhodobaculum claviforme]MBK5927965.1 cytochrome-c peroxidase [Rhodobaculum claviforme]